MIIEITIWELIAVELGYLCLLATLGFWLKAYQLFGTPNK